MHGPNHQVEAVAHCKKKKEERHKRDQHDRKNATLDFALHRLDKRSEGR